MKKTNKKDIPNIEEIRNKHESDLTPREMRLLEKDKLAHMDLKGKAGYIFTYYKIHIIAIVLLIWGAFGLKNYLYHLKDVTQLNVMVVSAYQDKTDEFVQGVKEDLGLSGEHDLVCMEAVHCEADGTMDYSYRTSFVTKVMAASVDMIFYPDFFYGPSMKGQDMLADLRDMLSEETLEKFKVSDDGYVLEIPAEVLPVDLALDYDIHVSVFVNAPKAENACAWLETLAGRM